MKIFSNFPTVNISKYIFLIVICIAKNFIWTTLNVIFSIFVTLSVKTQLKSFLCDLLFSTKTSSFILWKYNLYIFNIDWVRSCQRLKWMVEMNLWCVSHETWAWTSQRGSHLDCFRCTFLKYDYGYVPGSVDRPGVDPDTLYTARGEADWAPADHSNAWRSPAPSPERADSTRTLKNTH